ncbi:hypothetical protein PT300_15470 [Enterobacteriaceae bacterium ESL0689]|nr:hypothetical protein [Enterobacteriaceae bacterium ESL0689]MDF7681900.1 hypothetical protein [Enterobacteriaceae bacterium ESL0689]
MTTITINTYDPEARFDMDANEAKKFFDYVKEQAIAAGYDVEYASDIQVDEESERFTETCFQNY